LWSIVSSSTWNTQSNARATLILGVGRGTCCVFRGFHQRSWRPRLSPVELIAALVVAQPAAAFRRHGVPGPAELGAMRQLADELDVDASPSAGEKGSATRARTQSAVSKHSCIRFTAGARTSAADDHGLVHSAFDLRCSRSVGWIAVRLVGWRGALKRSGVNGRVAFLAEDLGHRLSAEAAHSRAIRRGFKVIANCDDRDESDGGSQGVA
jgi:hypothetical protein